MGAKRPKSLVFIKSVKNLKSKPFSLKLFHQRFTYFLLVKYPPMTILEFEKNKHYNNNNKVFFPKRVINENVTNTQFIYT